jgi:tetratricopeptide (TPR) repeat protein/outer membrane protein assembly factor BamB
VSIKGTLETFNLRELLQMLAFNQKVGTLMLETEAGFRSIYVERGRVGFVEGDLGASEALLGVIRRHDLVPDDRLARPVQIHERSGRFLGDVLQEMGLLDAEQRRTACEEAIGDRFFDLTLDPIRRFEFVEGQTLAPDGSAGEPLEPTVVVESILLDLTRKIDQWSALQEVVPSLDEVFEGTGFEVDVGAALAAAEVDVRLAERALPQLDGFQSLAQIGRESDLDSLTLVHVVAVLFQAGALRLVTTEDLLARGEDRLSRGEAECARTLLALAVQRGDGPPEARLRLADALEALGRKADAAQELETFSALADGISAPVVFDALHRAFALVPQESGTAARLCDFYLRNRPWLREHASRALEALRHLIHGAVTERRPLEAARRLKEFIANGDAPSEDLIVLSDLYAAGGESREAADAVFRRAEDLLLTGRVAPARSLLQRTLQLDPGRGDARSRLHVIDGQGKKRSRRRRVTTFLCLVALLVLGGVAAWWTYNEEAGKAVQTMRDEAEAAVTTAEAGAAGLLEAFQRRVEEVATSERLEEPLTAAAERLLQETRRKVDGAGNTIYAYAAELERYNATDHKEANLIILRHLEARRRNAVQLAENAIADAKKRGREALAAGEKAHASGLFEEAARQLRTAWNLAFEDEALRARAHLLLENVNNYRRGFDEARSQIELARGAGDVERTYQLTVDLLATRLDSDLTRQLKLPVRIVTTPPGATVHVGGVDTGLESPCVLEYSPFGATTLDLQLAGRVPLRFELPSFERIAADRAKARAWNPSLRGTLVEGPRWVLPASAGPYGAAWISNGLPVLLLADGSAVQSVDPETGQPGAPMRFRSPQAVRLAGSMPDGAEWRITGHRTLLVRPVSGTPWEVQALGRLERPPAVAAGVVVVVDEMGTAHGYEAGTGREKWRMPLGSPPAQGPRPSRLGFLVTTQGGTAFALSPETGESRSLAAAVGGGAMAVPLGDGALVLGTGPRGVLVVLPSGETRSLGPAAPLPGVEAWTSNEGVAWAEADGVRWIDTRTHTVQVLGGLGAGAVGLAGTPEGVVYAACADRTLRAVRLADPGQTLWQAGTGGTPQGAPLVLGHSLLVLVDGGLRSIAR